ncbi:MAG: hypothetical protein AAF653_13870, partial [Chloroflexota bacterium]
LVAGGRDRRVRLWDVESRAQSGDDMQGHVDHVLSVAFDDTGQFIYSGSEDGRLVVWDTQTQRQIGNAFLPGGGPVVGVAVVDGTLISAGEDGRVALFEAVLGRWQSLAGEIAGVPGDADNS